MYEFSVNSSVTLSHHFVYSTVYQFSLWINKELFKVPTFTDTNRFSFKPHNHLIKYIYINNHVCNSIFSKASQLSRFNDNILDTFV